MSIRLYPNCPPSDMERLAGVPTGTYDRLKVFEENKPGIDGPKMTAWYDKLYRDHDMVNLNNFITFGWGRLSPDTIDYIRKNFPEYDEAGYTDSPSHAQALIQAMGITAEGITSVRWS